MQVFIHYKLMGDAKKPNLSYSTSHFQISNFELAQVKQHQPAHYWMELNCLLVPVLLWRWILATWSRNKQITSAIMQRILVKTKCKSARYGRIFSISDDKYHDWYIYIYITLASKYHISNIWDFTWDSTIKMRMLLKSFVSTSIWFLKFFYHFGECFKYYYKKFGFYVSQILVIKLIVESKLLIWND